MKELDEPILKTIYENNYRRYIGGLWNEATAYANASQVFSRSDTPRKVWNALIIQKPHCCGKIHESIWSGITVGQCKNQNNPLCGHPEETQFFHGLWVAAYLSRMVQTDFPHVAPILRDLTNLDRLAQYMYWSDVDSVLWWTLGIAIGNDEEVDEQYLYETTWRTIIDVPTIKKQIQERERKLWEETIQPYMMRVSEVLRAA